MQATLRHPYADVQRAHPAIYEEWRAALEVYGNRESDASVSATYTDLFTEHLWACREELHDLLHLPGVLSVHLCTVPKRNERTSVRITVSYENPDTGEALLNQATHETPARSFPRTADLQSSCSWLRDVVKAHT